MNLTDEFYFLIKQVISVSGYLYEYPNWNSTTTTQRRRITSTTLDISSDLITNDLLSLIEDSLYVHELAALSLSIPTEAYTFDLENFGIYIARVSNETVNVTLGNVTIIISNNDTDDGRDDFEDTSDALDSVDVIIAVIDVNSDSPASYVDEGNQLDTESYDGCDGLQVLVSNTDNNGTGVLSSDEVSITIISGNNNTALHNLSSNVIIIFENVDLDFLGNNTQQLCVWYDEQHGIWNSEGCISTVNEEESIVICNCSHLTKFAVLSTLTHDDSNEPSNCGTETELNDLFGIGDYLPYFCFLFIFCFLSILLFLIYKMIILWHMKLFHKYKDKRESFNGILFCGVCGVLELIGCGMVLFYSVDDSLRTNNVYVEILTLILGLPLLFYFLMFTHALQAWITVSNSLKAKVSRDERKTKFIFAFTNVCVVVVFLVLIILLVFDIDAEFEDLFLYCEILWLSIMCIACFIFTFYSLKLRQVLSSTLSMVLTAHDKKQIVEQKKIIHRLTTVSLMLTLFFLIQTFVGIYGVYVQLSNINYDVSLTIFGLFLNLIYLSAFLYLYIPNINRVIHGEQRSIQRRLSRRTTNTRLKQSSLSTSARNRRRKSKNSNAHSGNGKRKSTTMTKTLPWSEYPHNKNMTITAFSPEMTPGASSDFQLSPTQTAASTPCGPSSPTSEEQSPEIIQLQDMMSLPSSTTNEEASKIGKNGNTNDKRKRVQIRALQLQKKQSLYSASSGAGLSMGADFVDIEIDDGGGRRRSKNGKPPSVSDTRVVSITSRTNKGGITSITDRVTPTHSRHTTELTVTGTTHGASSSSGDSSDEGYVTPKDVTPGPSNVNDSSTSPGDSVKNKNKHTISASTDQWQFSHFANKLYKSHESRKLFELQQQHNRRRSSQIQKFAPAWMVNGPLGLIESEDGQGQGAQQAQETEKQSQRQAQTHGGQNQGDRVRSRQNRAITSPEVAMYNPKHGQHNNGTQAGLMSIIMDNKDLKLSPNNSVSLFSRIMNSSKFKSNTSGNNANSNVADDSTVGTATPHDSDHGGYSTGNDSDTNMRGVRLMYDENDSSDNAPLPPPMASGNPAALRIVSQSTYSVAGDDEEVTVNDFENDETNTTTTNAISRDPMVLPGSLDTTNVSIRFGDNDSSEGTKEENDHEDDVKPEPAPARQNTGNVVGKRNRFDSNASNMEVPKLKNGTSNNASNSFIEFYMSRIKLKNRRSKNSSKGSNEMTVTQILEDGNDNGNDNENENGSENQSNHSNNENGDNNDDLNNNGKRKKKNRRVRFGSIINFISNSISINGSIAEDAETDTKQNESKENETVKDKDENKHQNDSDTHQNRKHRKKRKKKKKKKKKNKKNSNSMNKKANIGYNNNNDDINVDVVDTETWMDAFSISSKDRHIVGTIGTNSNISNVSRVSAIGTKSNPVDYINTNTNTTTNINNNNNNGMQNMYDDSRNYSNTDGLAGILNIYENNPNNKQQQHGRQVSLGGWSAGARDSYTFARSRGSIYANTNSIANNGIHDRGRLSQASMSYGDNLNENEMNDDDDDNASSHYTENEYSRTETEI